MKESKLSSCDIWSEKLSMPLEDLLPSDLHALQTHLQKCPRCALARAEYQMLGTLMHSLPVPSLSAELPPRLIAYWQEEKQSEEVPESSHQHPLQTSDIDLPRTIDPTAQAEWKQGSFTSFQIDVQSYSKGSETLPEEQESVELIVEDAVSLVLIDLFGEAIVDKISVHFSSPSHTGYREGIIHIQAQYALESFTLFPRTDEYIQLAVERGICAILKELFGPVTIEKHIIAQPSKQAYEF